MDDIDSIGYVVLGVPDLDRATAYLSEVCRLAVVEAGSGRAYLTGDERHHWFRLEAADDARLLRLGYRATGPAAVDRLADRLAGAGVAVGEVAADPSVSGAIRFTDPNGLEVDVYTEMVETPFRPDAAYEGLELLLHAVVQVPDPLASAAFYEDVCGFRRSDRIADLVVFLRAANGFHHSLALAKGERSQLDHVAVHVRDLDDVMRLRSHGMATGTLSDDVVRHTASGSISVYLRDDVNRLGIEFCTGHTVIDRDDYRGRVLLPSATTVNQWSDPFPLTGWHLDLDRIHGAKGATDAARTAIGPAPVDARS